MARGATTADIALLEEMAFRAWPAAEVVDLGGWRLRATSGVTRRANSAWTTSMTGNLSLDERIERTERFYSERELPAYFHVAPISRPLGLDAALASRGYVVEAPVSIQVNTLRRVTDATNEDGLECTVTAQYTAEWLRLSTERGRFGAVEAVYRGILDRLAGRCGFAVVYRGVAAIAIGLAVVDGQWAGFFNMLTVPEDRRLGAARRVLVGLSRWATERGASQAYLQVERASTAAVTLYASVGFEEVHGYHYRVLKQAT